MQFKTSKFFFEKYIFLICIVLIIFFWFFSNKIPFLNYHIGLGTEFDYAWANSINYGNSIIFKNHFLDFYNSLILPNLEIGKNINISPYNIFNPFYFLSHIGFGQFSIFFSTLITAILCLYSLQRILIIFKIDNFTSIIISYLVITFWSLKFTQDHFQMLSSYHFLIIYLHFFIESKYTNKTNYIYFIFCFLLAPQVAHIGFVVWILIPSIIGIAFIKKIKNIIFFALLSLAWLPWLLTLSNRNLNVISNINQNFSKLKIFDFQNFFLENKFQSFLANDNFWLSFVYPMKVVGMTYIPIGLFLFSILIFFFLKTYRHKINSFLIIITLITIFNILFINTNIFTDIMGRSMNRFLFNFISLLIYLFIIFNFIILASLKFKNNLKNKNYFEQIIKKKIFWIIIFILCFVIDLFNLGLFYKQENRYSSNFNISLAVLTIYIFLFSLFLFVKKIKSQNFLIIFIIFSLIYPFTFYSVNKKNYLGNDFNSFRKLSICLDQVYSKNQFIRIISTGESDRGKRNQLRIYNNLNKYILDYNSGTNQNYLFKYYNVPDNKSINAYIKNFNYSRYYRSGGKNVYPPSIYTINKNKLFKDFHNIGVDYILYIEPFNDKLSNKLIKNFQIEIGPFFSKENRFCNYKDSKVFIFKSKLPFSDAYNLSEKKKIFLNQIKFNKWELNKKNLNNDIIIMNSFSKYSKVYVNSKIVPHEEYNGFIKIQKKYLSEGYLNLIYLNVGDRIWFIFNVLSYFAMLILVIDKLRVFVRRSYEN